MPNDEMPDRVPADLVIVAPHLGDGGAQRVISTLANAWVRKGRKIYLITLYGSDEVYALDPLVRRIRITRAAANRAAPSPPRTQIRLVQRTKFYASVFRQTRKLRRSIQRLGAPVVLSFTGSANIMSVLACLGLDKRVIISERNDPASQILKPPWNTLRPLVYKHASVVTANSRGALEAMRGYVDGRKLAFAPNPLICDGAVPASPSVPGSTDPFVLTVARLHPQKAHDLLLEAFARISQRLRRWRLAIVGRGLLEGDLRAQAADLRIDDRLDWHGQVANPYVYYRAARIFVLASRHEGMPNALMEALSCGLPAIVSNASPGPLELVTHGESGWVVPANNVAALAEAIELLATDAALRERLGRSGPGRVSEYELEKALPAWEQIIGWQEPPQGRFERR